ncbi:MAG: ATP-binding protein [Thermoplasmata archaeon]|nr:ATP-binding protein [Thermoplasmata archaeon]
MEVSVSDIKLYNPHLDGERFEVPERKRAQFEEVKKALRRGMIVGIVGLRRVGKTVLIKQVLNSIIDGGEEVFYFSFDEERYANAKSLNWIINFALRRFDNPVVALDEVSRVKNWAGVVKKFYDSRRVRFIVSGSASLEITKGKESLAGRLYDLYMPPLQYPEYLEFIGEKAEEIELSLTDPELSFLRWKPHYHLDDFLKRGGFPEIVGEQDDVFTRRYILNNCIEKIVFEDLPRTLGVEHPNVLFHLWELAVSDPGLTFVPSNLQGTFGVSKDTLLKYAFYLEKAFLLKVITKEGSPYSRLRKGRKLYPFTPSMAALPGGASSGKLAEAAVFDRIYNGMGIEPRFYRDPRGWEVDFLIDGLAVEVKYRGEITTEDLRGTLSYMKKAGAKNGIVVTKDRMDVVEKGGRKIILVPLEMFLQIRKIVR